MKERRGLSQPRSLCAPVRRQQTYEEFQLPRGSCAGDGAQLSQRNGISHRRP